jgi:uncharacterized protein (TIGR00369 family)
VGMHPEGQTPPLPPGKEQEVRDSFSRQRLLIELGCTMCAVGSGTCSLELPFSPLAGQQHGFFHGGLIGTLGDVAGGCAALALLPSGSEVLTLEYKINFLRPALGERLRAEGRVLRKGGTVLVTRVDVHVLRDGNHSLCAALQQTMMRPDGAMGLSVKSAPLKS